jgi:hypothetical protein
MLWSLNAQLPLAGGALLTQRDKATEVKVEGEAAGYAEGAHKADEHSYQRTTAHNQHTAAVINQARGTSGCAGSGAEVVGRR